MKGSLEERLLNRRSISEDGHWLWQGKSLSHGFGSLGRGGRGTGAVMAHRAAAELWLGLDPDSNALVLQSCGIRLCFNPDHLYISNRRFGKSGPSEERFWRFVPRDIGEDECWPWQGSRAITGYGKFQVAGRKPMAAHRAAYSIFVGTIPDGMVVCHHCDSPPCVNPRHLFLGTAKDNMQDKIAKGRGPQPASAIFQIELPEGSWVADFIRHAVDAVEDALPEARHQPRILDELDAALGHLRTALRFTKEDAETREVRTVLFGCRKAIDYLLGEKEPAHAVG